MRLEVEDLSPDRLRRRLWTFSLGSGFLILVRFANEGRPTPRHKFRPVAKWESSDERAYNSQLKRPESIPAWVVDEALKKLPPPVVTVGWGLPQAKATITPEPKGYP
jgi:hypothetical protein